MDLAVRRAEIVAAHKALEKVRGSGWHPADLGAEQREQRNELPLSERPIAFQDDDKVRMIGDCAKRVRVALAEWAKAAVTRPQTSYQAAVDRCVERVSKMNGDIELATQEWNYLNHALTEAGVQTVLTTV